MRSSHSMTLWGVTAIPPFALPLPILLFTSLFLTVRRYLFAAQSLEQLAVGPPQIHRVEPPAARASAHELESTGDALQVDKNYLDAVDYYEAALAKDPHSAVLVNKIGISQLQLHRYKDARKSFERSIRIDKTYANAYANLGVIYYEEASYGKSIRNYDKAISLDKDAAVFYNNRAAALFAKKDFEKASLDYAKAFELDPEFSSAASGAEAFRQGCPRRKTVHITTMSWRNCMRETKCPSVRCTICEKRWKMATRTSRTYIKTRNSAICARIPGSPN